MALRYSEWREKGYWLLLVEARLGYYHLLISTDDKSYAIYDRFAAPFLEAARATIRFDPAAYEAVAPPFPIAKERALAGETGIPPFMEPVVQGIENMPWRGEERDE